MARGLLVGAVAALLPIATMPGVSLHRVTVARAGKSSSSTWRRAITGRLVLAESGVGKLALVEIR